MRSVFLSLVALLCLTFTNGVLTVLAADEPDGILGDILNPIVDLLECKKGSPEVKMVCELVSDQIRSSLAAVKLSLTRDALIYSYDDQSDISIPTGHGCSITARINRARAWAKLDASASIDFSGNPFKSAGVVAVKLPVELSAKVDCEQRYGVKNPFNGHCQIVGTDAFDASGRISTVAALWVFFALAPSFKQNDKGDFVVTIKPITDVTAKLENTQVDVHISGKSPLAAITDTVMAFPGSYTKLLFDYYTLNVQDTMDVLTQQFPVDLGIGTVMSIPDSVLSLALTIFAKQAVDKELKGKDARFSEDLKVGLKRAVANALGLSANGERQWILKKDFMALLQQFGVGADIWIKPEGGCLTNRDCDDGKFCNGVETCRAGKCVPGKWPCPASQPGGVWKCVEVADSCVFQVQCDGGSCA